MSYKKTMEGVNYLVQNEFDMACEDNKDSIPHYISRGVMYAYKEDLDRWRNEQKAKGEY